MMAKGFIKKNDFLFHSQILISSRSRNGDVYKRQLIYSLNSKVEMAYKLDGVDKDWVYLSNDKNSAFYNQFYATRMYSADL